MKMKSIHSWWGQRGSATLAQQTKKVETLFNTGSPDKQRESSNGSESLGEERHQQNNANLDWIPTLDLDVALDDRLAAFIWGPDS